MLDKGALYKLLNNRVYIGEAVHKGEAYPASTRPSSAPISGGALMPS